MAADEKVKKALVIDYRTGAYSQRELAKKYNVSKGTVSAWTKETGQELGAVVDKKIELNQLSTGLTKEELGAIDIAVQFKENFARDVQNFGVLAIRKAASLLENEETGQGYKAIVDGVDKLTVMQKHNPRFATTAQIEINNTNAQQNNVTAQDLAIEERLKARHRDQLD